MCALGIAKSVLSKELQSTCDFFLKKNTPEFGDAISNLKLQKLVYYAQGFHLALYGSELFPEEIVAWEHGPVVEPLYFKYNEHGSLAIPEPASADLTVFSKEQISLLSEVYDVYGQFSAWKLRNMTHSERPWLETPKNDSIDKALMKEFFKTLLN